MNVFRCWIGDQGSNLGYRGQSPMLYPLSYPRAIFSRQCLAGPTLNLVVASVVLNPADQQPGSTHQTMTAAPPDGCRNG